MLPAPEAQQAARAVVTLVEDKAAAVVGLAAEQRAAARADLAAARLEPIPVALLAGLRAA